MLHGKHILLGVSSSIALYKAASVCSALKKLGADVHVLMTENATKMMAPVIFEQLTGNRACVDTFDRNFEWKVEHISLAKMADLLLVAPATANVCAKLAHGIADDMLTTTALACTCPKLIAPAMNTRMFENPVTQENLQTLRRFGWQVIEPASGHLACGDSGAGKLPEPETLVQFVRQELEYEKDLQGLRVLVTAGPTREALDPVRYLSNRSTGKMGYAVARAAAARGAQVTLISGPVDLAPPPFLTTVPVVSAEEMYQEVTSRFPQTDIVIKAAAVADYRPAEVAGDKIKKGDGEMNIPLMRTRDILGFLGEHRRPDQTLCGFSMETRDMLENSRRKLEKKHLDLIAANNVKVPGAGFAVDTNVLTLITRDREEELPLLSKDEAAHRLLDAVIALRRQAE